jgi:hypothetical protein
MHVPLRLIGPAIRGLVLQKGKSGPTTTVPVKHESRFNWTYKRGKNEFARLYDLAKRSQWNASEQLDWSINVDPHDPNIDLVPDEWTPLPDIRAYRLLPKKTQQLHRKQLLTWMLSQFLHGEQGALFAACQVTEAIQEVDGKLFGSTQVVDEGRHVEVFTRYLTEKMEKLYDINDNLYTIIDALMTDSRWDMKFLGMQIMIEGLALGAFATLRNTTQEPLLRELLRYVIMDEARHVHYGVVTLQNYYADLSPRKKREREDWAFEIALLLRNRFLAHEFYEEYYAHLMTRQTWNKIILRSKYMERFRRTMFRRLIPNLKRIHLLSDRMRPHYESIGLLQWESEKAAPELTIEEAMQDAPQN